MTNIELTDMQLADIPEVIAIEGQVFTSAWTEGMFRQEVSGVFNSHTTVARADGRLVGYQVAWFIEQEVHLVNIAVHPGYQRKGVGRRMLERLIDHALARGMRMITLEVRESNASAQRFYRRFLFETIGLRRGYYSDNREDALLMVLDLGTYAERKGGDEGSVGTR